VLVDKERTRRGGEQGEEHSVLPEAEKWRTGGYYWTDRGHQGFERGEATVLSPSRGEKWRIGGYLWTKS
jgi:hypothetical protein